MKNLLLIIISVLGAATNINSQSKKELFNSASEKIKLKDYQGAIVIYNNLVNKDSTNAEAFLLMGNCYDSLNDNVSALKYFSKAIELNSKSEYALIGRASVRMNVFQIKAGIIDINKAIEINPKNPISYNVRGNLKQRQHSLDKNNDSKEIIEDYELALKLKPNNFVTINNIAKYYAYVGEYEKALSNFKESLKINPKQPLVYSETGWIKKAQLHDTIGALKDYDACLNFPYSKDLDPYKNYLNAYVARGTIYLGQHNYKKSFDDFNTVVKLAEYVHDDAHYYRGISAYHLNNYELAIKDFSVIIDMSTKAASENTRSSADYYLDASYFYRGNCYFNSNQKKEACLDWENAKRLGIGQAGQLIQENCK